MRRADTDLLKTLAWPTYFVALLLVCTPVLDFGANVWPLRIGEVSWRYGSVALFTGYMLTPLFGILFALCAAAVLNHYGVIRVVSVINVALAVLILVLLALFALDAFQFRAQIPEEGRRAFDFGALRAVLKYLSMVVAFVWLGVAGVRATRSSYKTTRHAPASEVPLVRSEGVSK